MKHKLLSIQSNEITCATHNPFNVQKIYLLRDRLPVDNLILNANIIFTLVHILNNMKRMNYHFRMQKEAKNDIIWHCDLRLSPRTHIKTEENLLQTVAPQHTYSYSYHTMCHIPCNTTHNIPHNIHVSTFQHNKDNKF